MSNFNKAADDIQNLANKLKPLFELQKFLSEVGSLDQAANEAKARKELALKEAASAALVALDAKKDLDKVEKQISYAEDKAQEILDNASKKASEYFEAAKLKAQEVIYAADKKKSDIDSQFSAACKELASVQAEVAAEKNKLEEVKAQVSSIKSKLQAFVGG